MNKLYILMGAPGSGKSTWVKNHLNTETDMHVSRDIIRFNLVNENEPYFSKEKQVFKEFIKQINLGLDEGKNVFADATHLTAASRNKLLRAISIIPNEIDVIWIKVPLKIALSQNKTRYGTRLFVPESQVRDMYFSIIEPKFEEGFNRIYEIENNLITIREEVLL